MNQEEGICRPYQAEVRCFDKIPDRFAFDGNIDDKSCSVIFPPGYSIYIEEFDLKDPGPDNFVLVDGLDLEYNSKVKWENREKTMWTNLHKGHPLKKETNRRFNFPCVKTLKVTKC